ncbi:MAG TPA: hypothetical protein VFY06_14040 [Verrucomicrobiae bacterium]|nr:hypothetical protein [Verrucomicrobiae bacterium]
MKPPQMFGVIVRTTGLLAFLYGLYNLPGGLDSVIESLLSGGFGGDSGSAPILSHFVFGIPEFITGVLCFLLADWIVGPACRNTAPQ